MIGAAGFGAASVLAAFATSAELLIAARALLGVAAATLAPSTLSLIRNMFHDPRQRTIAIGLWVTSYSAGAAIGPLIGGLLLAHFWWGSVFLISVPVMVLLLAVGPRLLPESRDPEPGALRPEQLCALAGERVRRDLRGQADRGGRRRDLAALSIALGLLVGIAFLRRQGKLADPMIDLRLFRAPAFSIAVTANALALFTVYGMDLFIAQYLQLVLGMSPFEAGLWLLPCAVGFVVGSNLAPLIAGRVSTGTWWPAARRSRRSASRCSPRSAPSSGLAVLVAGSVVMAFGAAQVITLGTDLVVGSAPPERAGAASAISETGLELGGALGIALLGSIGTAVYRSEAGSEPLAADAVGTIDAASAGVRPRHAAGRGHERDPDGARSRRSPGACCASAPRRALGRSRRSPGRALRRVQRAATAATTPPIAPNRWPCQEMPRCGSSPPSSAPPQITATTAPTASSAGARLKTPRAIR